MTLDSLSAKDQNDVVVPLNQGGDTTKATFTKLVYDYTADVSEKASELRLTLRHLSSYRMDADMTVTVPAATGAGASPMIRTTALLSARPCRSP